MKLAYHTYTCLYGTFLCNTDFERISNNLDTRTLSVWSLLNVNSKEFINDLFNQTKTEVRIISFIEFNLTFFFSFRIDTLSIIVSS